MKEAPVKVGDVLAGKYLVESILGVGGMGVVVEALHLELHETRAVKLMLPEAVEDRDAVERFMREARASCRLKSEYVAHVYDVDKLESGAPYMVMEYLRGSDLRHVLKDRGRLPASEAVHYALHACEALAEAHSLGIVHRDLKPGNLFLTLRTDGTPCIKVLDFGISKVLGNGDDEMTKTQTVLGSPSYMSPEQMKSPRTVDARTDIWSLGVILYRLVTGELPFRADTMPELVTKVLAAAPRAPSAVCPDVPRELDAVLLRCFERDLDVRYASVGELSAALLPFAPSEARASVERIARVLAVASHGRGALGPLPAALPSAPRMPLDLTVVEGVSASRALPPPPVSSPPRGSGTSGDAWANTSFGGATVAVHRWKLWALVAACGALTVAFGASMLVARHTSSAAPDPAPAGNAPVGDAPVAHPEAKVAVPALTAAASPPPAVTTPAPLTAAPPVATTMPVATATTAATAPGPVAAAGTVKGPLRPFSARPVKTAEPAPPTPPPPVAPPPVATTAPHRMFGSEN